MKRFLRAGIALILIGGMVGDPVTAALLLHACVVTNQPASDIGARWTQEALQVKPVLAFANPARWRWMRRIAIASRTWLDERSWFRLDPEVAHLRPEFRRRFWILHAMGIIEGFMATGRYVALTVTADLATAHFKAAPGGQEKTLVLSCVVSALMFVWPTASTMWRTYYSSRLMNDFVARVYDLAYDIGLQVFARDPELPKSLDFAPNMLTYGASFWQRNTKFRVDMVRHTSLYIFWLVSMTQIARRAAQGLTNEASGTGVGAVELLYGVIAIIGGVAVFSMVRRIAAIFAAMADVNAKKAQYAGAMNRELELLAGPDQSKHTWFNGLEGWTLQVLRHNFSQIIETVNEQINLDLRFAVWSEGPGTLMSIAISIGGLWSLAHYGHPTIQEITAVGMLVDTLQKYLVSTLQIVQSMASTDGYLRKLKEFLRLAAERGYRPRSLLPQPALDGSITLSGVAFDRPERAVLKDVSLHIRPGERVIIAGDNGAGKSTLLDLIVGYLRVKSGNVNIDEWSALESRGSQAYLSQRNVLLKMRSVRDNLLRWKPSATESEMRQALSDAKADFVFKKPKGLDTMGEAFSGGEERLLEVAGALLAHRRILLLDEPTKEVDEMNRVQFGAMITEISAKTGVTVLWTAHSTTIPGFSPNRIFRIENKRLVEVTPESHENFRQSQDKTAEAA